MECPRGAVCTESVHPVKTIDKAREWFSCSEAEHLPLRIEQRKGEGGRLLIKVYSRDGLLLSQRG